MPRLRMPIRHTVIALQSSTAAVDYYLFTLADKICPPETNWNGVNSGYSREPNCYQKHTGNPAPNKNPSSDMAISSSE